jgi:hypothetical protein
VSINSRAKGAVAEREVRDIVRKAGYRCERDGQIDNFAEANADLRHDVRGVHFEVKRRETLALPQWTRQAEEDARPDEQAVVVYRRSREPWRASVDFEWLLYLLKCRDKVESGG